LTVEIELAKLFQRWQTGDENALHDLMPLVYNRLKQIASRAMAQESSRHTLQTTAIVNELYLKLLKQSPNIIDRKQFYALCAKIIRNLLIDHARNKSRDKRWGSLKQVTLGDANISFESDQDILALDSALTRLEKIDPAQQQYLMLHYFGGLSYDEVAEVSEISRAQVGRELKMAKAWLSLQLSS